MKLIDNIKSVFDLNKWTDKALVDETSKQLPSLYYPDGSTGQPPLPEYNLVDPMRYRGGEPLSFRPEEVFGRFASSNLMNLFHCVPEIFAPVHAIASRIANADFQLRKWFNDEVVYNNPYWNALFDAPNPLQHFRELIYEAVVYELITGDEYMYINIPGTLARDYKNVVSLWNLPADQMEAEMYDSSLKLFSATSIEDLVKFYKLGEEKNFDPKDVMHIRSINLNWGDKKLKGTSVLCSAKKAIANLVAVYEARNVIYTKRGALGFIVSRKSDANGQVSLTPKEKKELREEYNGTYGLTGAKSPVGITEAPVDYIKVGATISELEPFKETLADAMAIYATLGVPRELMPQEQGATYENQKQADRGFYQNVIIPKANTYMMRLTKKLGLEENRLYLHASFDHVDVLQEDKRERADVDKIKTDTCKVRFMSGIITLNDWVVESGYEKQGNQLYDKRIFDMTPEEQATVLTVMKAAVPQNNNNDNGNQQQSGSNSGDKAK